MSDLMNTAASFNFSAWHNTEYVACEAELTAAQSSKNSALQRYETAMKRNLAFSTFAPAMWMYRLIRSKAGNKTLTMLSLDVSEDGFGAKSPLRPNAIGKALMALPAYKDANAAAQKRMREDVSRFLLLCFATRGDDINVNDPSKPITRKVWFVNVLAAQGHDRASAFASLLDHALAWESEESWSNGLDSMVAWFSPERSPVIGDNGKPVMENPDLDWQVVKAADGSESVELLPVEGTGTPKLEKGMSVRSVNEFRRDILGKSLGKPKAKNPPAEANKPADTTAPAAAPAGAAPAGAAPAGAAQAATTNPPVPGQSLGTAPASNPATPTSDPADKAGTGAPRMTCNDIVAAFNRLIASHLSANDFDSADRDIGQIARALAAHSKDVAEARANMAKAAEAKAAKAKAAAAKATTTAVKAA